MSDPARDELRFGEWQPLLNTLGPLYARVAVMDNAEFITRNWDCKYIDARIDMRTGKVKLTPGNTHDY